MPNDNHISKDEKFDFVIIGAGSAGCVLADFLSRSGKHKILLLEAGGKDWHPWLHIPIGYSFTFRDPRFNWQYTAKKDAMLNNREAYWPRGKTLGGSSAINAMVYARGLPNDFNDWVKNGAKGWEWENVKKTYEGLEQHQHITSKTDKNITNKKLAISDMRDKIHPFNQNFYAAARELGWPLTNNINDEATEGLGPYPVTIKNGFRCSASVAYLKEAKNRANLKIITHAHVKKIIVKNNIAHAVLFHHKGKDVTLQAEKEVILSAGAINSPHILQLSGIGNGDDLKKIGIDIIHHLKEVGQGLQDHLAISYYYRANMPTLNDKLSPFHGKVIAFLQYIFSRRGTLAMSVNQTGGFMRSLPEYPPDIQLYCTPASYTTVTGSVAKLHGESGYLLSFQPCRPKSRGRIITEINDAMQAPAIYPESLSKADDCKAVLRGARLVQKLISTDALKNVTIGSFDKDVQKMNDDEILDDFKARASTVFHPCCTCRMGNDEKDSVLDSEMKLHGVKNLRVVDASAFPNITSGNTNAPTIMLAHRAANFILNDYR